MRVRAGWARRVVRVAVACAVGIAGVGLWAGPALAVQCPSRAKECRDWAKVPGRGWMTDVVCPKWYSKTMTERVRNLTENELVLAVKNIDCNDWSNTGNPSQITGRVVGPGGTATWRLEVASTAYYDLGFFVRDRSGLRRVGKVNLVRSKWGELSVYGYGSNSRVTTTNTGESFRNIDARCVRLLLGEDPKRTESKVSWDWRDHDATFVYSDGANLYAVRCASVEGAIGA
jgi:hypothetical protein